MVATVTQEKYIQVWNCKGCRWASRYCNTAALKNNIPAITMIISNKYLLTWSSIPRIQRWTRSARKMRIVDKPQMMYKIKPRKFWTSSTMGHVTEDVIHIGMTVSKSTIEKKLKNQSNPVTSSIPLSTVMIICAYLVT